MDATGWAAGARPGEIGGEIKYYFPIKRYYLPLDETRRITEPISSLILFLYSDLDLSVVSCIAMRRVRMRKTDGERGKGSVRARKRHFFGFSSSPTTSFR